MDGTERNESQFRNIVKGRFGRPYRLFMAMFTRYVDILVLSEYCKMKIRVLNINSYTVQQKSGIKCCIIGKLQLGDLRNIFRIPSTFSRCLSRNIWSDMNELFLLPQGLMKIASYASILRYVIMVNLWMLGSPVFCYRWLFSYGSLIAILALRFAWHLTIG